MGEQKVHLPKTKEDLKAFIRSLLDDVRALEYMLQNDWFENDIRRIGAEQEMVLINLHDHKPAMLGQTILDQMQEYSWLESELALFNLEITLTPQTFEADCLSKLEKETSERLNIIRAQLKRTRVPLYSREYYPLSASFTCLWKI